MARIRPISRRVHNSSRQAQGPIGYASTAGVRSASLRLQALLLQFIVDVPTRDLFLDVPANPVSSLLSARRTMFAGIAKITAIKGMAIPTASLEIRR